MKEKLINNKEKLIKKSIMEDKITKFKMFCKILLYPQWDLNSSANSEEE